MNGFPLGMPVSSHDPQNAYKVITEPKLLQVWMSVSVVICVSVFAVKHSRKYYMDFKSALKNT